MTNYGGARKGAGRKTKPRELLKIPVNYKLPRWLVEWLREKEKPAAQLIEAALIEKHGLVRPKKIPH